MGFAGAARLGSQSWKREQLEACLQELLQYQCPVKATAGPALFAALASGDDQPDVDAAQRHRDDGDAVFRFLDKLPGLEPPRPDLQGHSLAQLASLDTDALTRILGSDRARRFAAFCTRPMEPVPLSEIEKNQPKRKRGRSPPRPRKR